MFAVTVLGQVLRMSIQYPTIYDHLHSHLFTILSLNQECGIVDSQLELKPRICIHSFAISSLEPTIYSFYNRFSMYNIGTYITYHYLTRFFFLRIL